MQLSLEQALKRIEQEQEQALQELNGIPCADELKKQAEMRIKINLGGIKVHIHNLYEDGFYMDDTLKKDSKTYDSNGDYRLIYNHIENHLNRVGFVLSNLRTRGVVDDETDRQFLGY